VLLEPGQVVRVGDPSDDAVAVASDEELPGAAELAVAVRKARPVTERQVDGDLVVRRAVDLEKEVGVTR